MKLLYSYNFNSTIPGKDAIFIEILKERKDRLLIGSRFNIHLHL